MDNLDWAMLSLEHPILGKEPTDPVSLMLHRIATIPGLMRDERTVLSTLAMHATAISLSGTMAHGVWPGNIRIGINTGIGFVRIGHVCKRLQRSGVLAYSDKFFGMDVCANRWGEWMERQK